MAAMYMYSLYKAVVNSVRVYGCQVQKLECANHVARSTTGSCYVF